MILSTAGGKTLGAKSSRYLALQARKIGKVIWLLGPDFTTGPNRLEWFLLSRWG